MKNVAWVLIVILILGLSNISCSTGAAKTTAPSTASTASITVKPGSSAVPSAITTPIARPSGGKPQELTFTLKAPFNVYNMVIYLANGETLSLDWKFVANPQVAIYFTFTTPEGREMDANLQPINLPGHPLYDKNLPSKNPVEAVGSHVEINVGQDQYCDEGYYSLIFSGSPEQSGTVYLRYSLTSPTK